jgi:uncharacterized protein (TIGR01777 family)
MKVVISGSSGLIGSAVVGALARNGESVTTLVRERSAGGSESVLWRPETGTIDSTGLESHDAVVHLAGESVAGGRWTKARKDRIRSSRVAGTRLLCEALAKMASPPGVLVCASAIGFYGSRGEEILTESSSPGEGFLATVCRDWEAAAEPARARGIRVVHLRFGVVLSSNGGALAQMLRPFRLGLGGVLGDGRQYMSWIHLDDAVGAVRQVLADSSTIGAVNAVSPHPVTNREFTQTLARVLGRAAIVPLPRIAARLAFGEMADALLLASSRAQPTRLLASGYTFRHAHLEAALRHLLSAAEIG